MRLLTIVSQPNIIHLAITWQPGFSLDCGKVASCQRQPQRKDPLSRYTFHVSCGALIEFSVLPHQKAAGIRAKAPLTLVLQSNVRMFVVLHVKGLKELAKALDGRISLHRPPAIDCTMRHSRLMFGVARMEGACHPCLGRVLAVSWPCLGRVWLAWRHAAVRITGAVE